MVTLAQSSLRRPRTFSQTAKASLVGSVISNELVVRPPLDDRGRRSDVGFTRSALRFSID